MKCTLHAPASAKFISQSLPVPNEEALRNNRVYLSISFLSSLRKKRMHTFIEFFIDMYLHVFIEFEFVNMFSFSLFFYFLMYDSIYFPKKETVLQTSNQGPGLFYGNICSLAESFLRGKIEVVTNMAGKWISE